MDPVAQYFVGSRSLVGFRLMEADGGFIVDNYSRLIDVVSKRCGAQVAALFAEPHISYGNGKAPARIDWYTRFDGIARPLIELDPNSATAVERTLSTRLAALRSLAFDPEYGSLIAAALNIADPSAILSVGADPVLVDWGILPQSSLASERQRTQHFNSTLGPFLPDFPTPPLDAADWAATFMSTHSGTAPGGSSGGTGGGHGGGDGSNGSSGAEAPPDPPRRQSSLVAPIVATGMAAAALAALWLPGVLEFPASAKAVSADELKRAKTVVATLEAQSRSLDDLMKADCPTLTKANQSGAIIPPRLEDVRVAIPAPPDAPPGASPQALEPLHLRMTDATVLILAGDGTGSGFFLSSDTIMTNRHVVKDKAEVLVASKVIGVVTARVQSRSEQGEHYDDYAVLKLPPQEHVKPLELAALPHPLQQVVAVGYPGTAMGTDPIFVRVINGDADASRELNPVFSMGQVNHVQPQPGDSTLVVHSAEISPGNSGGPLVDLCGRVVGINTFGRAGSSGIWRTVTWRYALGSDGVRQYATQAGARVTSSESACSPMIASAQAIPPTPTATLPSPSSKSPTPANLPPAKR